MGVQQQDTLVISPLPMRNAWPLGATFSIALSPIRISPAGLNRVLGLAASAKRGRHWMCQGAG